MKKVFFALISYLSAINSIQASDNLTRYREECLSVIERPKVTVTSSYGKLRYDFSKDEEWLKNETAKKFKQQNMDEPEDFSPIGLTKVRDGFDFNMTVGRIEVSHGYSCLYPEEIKAHIGYYVPTVYILKDLSPESCLYKLSLWHEKTHVYIYIEALDYFLPEFKKTAEGLFDKAGVRIIAKGESAEIAAKELNEAYLGQMRNKVEHWRKEVEIEQLKLDSPENYILENKLCEEVDGKE